MHRVKMLTMFWIAIWLYMSAFCRGENNVHAFGTFSPIYGKICSVDDRVFHHNGTTALMCVALCSEQTSCLSVFYKKGSQACIGCDDVYYDNTLLLEEAGTEYFLDAQVMTGWSYFQDEYYRHFTDGVSPTAAQVICRRLIGRLAVIDSQEKNNFLQGLITGKNEDLTTIGLSDFEENGVYRWMDDGSTAEYTNWYVHEPTDQIHESCAAIVVRFGYKWADINCDSYVIAYVCTRKEKTITKY